MACLLSAVESKTATLTSCQQWGSPLVARYLLPAQLSKYITTQIVPEKNALSVLTRLSAHRSDLFGLSVHARREAVCPPESMQTCRFPWCRASFKLPLYRMAGHCISMVDLFSTLEGTATTTANRQERGSFTAVAPMLRASDKLHG